MDALEVTDIVFGEINRDYDPQSYNPNYGSQPVNFNVKLNGDVIQGDFVYVYSHWNNIEIHEAIVERAKEIYYRWILWEGKSFTVPLDTAH